MGNKNFLKKIGVRFLVCGLMIVCIFCACQIFMTLYEYYTADRMYGDLEETYVEASKPDAVEQKPEFPEFKINMKAMESINEDFTGWLYYKDAKISLPLVQESKDNVGAYEEYDFEGKKSSSGCPFIAFDADPDMQMTNTYIYGHNMKNGSMFGTLKLLYRDKENITDPYFYIFTATGEKIKYRVLAMYVIPMDGEMYRVPKNEEEQTSYFAAMLRKGSITKWFPLEEREQAAVEENNPIVTLYTCYGAAGTTNRLLVQGVEVLREYINEMDLRESISARKEGRCEE